MSNHDELIERLERDSWSASARHAASAIRSLVAERDALQQQVDALQQKVPLCAGYDALVSENEAYRQWYDAHRAIIANYRLGGRSE